MILTARTYSLNMPWGTSKSAEHHKWKEQHGDDKHTGKYYCEDHPSFATVS